MSTAPVPAAVVRRRRLQLLLIAALFFGPLALAFFFYYGGTTPARSRTNHGELIEPARALPRAGLASAAGTAPGEQPLRGTWSLVYITAGHCDPGCLRALSDTRAVRAALGADAGRVRRVLIVTAPCCASPLAAVRPDDRELMTLWLDGAAGRELLALFSHGAQAADQAGAVYVVDPRGNLLMRYPPGADPRGLLKDLERLLRLSQIG